MKKKFIKNKQCSLYYFDISNPNIIDEIRCENTFSDEEEIYCKKHRGITPGLLDEDKILSSDFHIHETHISKCHEEFLSGNSSGASGASGASEASGASGASEASFYHKFTISPRFPNYGVKFYIGEISFYLSCPRKVFLNYWGISQEIEIIRFQLIALSKNKEEIFKFKLVPILKDDITFPKLPHHIIVYNAMTDIISDDKKSEYINFKNINSDLDLIDLYSKTSGLNLIYDKKLIYGASYAGFNFISNIKDASLSNIIKFNPWMY